MNWALICSLINRIPCRNEALRPQTITVTLAKRWWTRATLLLTYYYGLALSWALQLLRGLFAHNVTLPLQYAIGLINAHAFITINTKPRFTSTLINPNTGEIRHRVYTDSRYHANWQWTIQQNINSIYI